MNKWLRKSLFALISVLTFGLVTPTQLINPANAETMSDRDAIEATAAKSSIATRRVFEESEFDRESFMEELINQAKLQSYQKFGSKIKPVIENEFREIILPNIQIALTETASQFPEDVLKNLSITEQPGAGLSEKIFNIKNSVSGKDILRFHVRRDNPPKEGFWFNFHYHSSCDGFQSHQDLGSIYWDKNTPPKWMS